MAIESLHLKNFQIHKDRLIEFSEGLNTIIGDNDHGKTAIIRCFRWIALNRPRGDSFIRRLGSTNTLAKFSSGHLLMDGHTIVRYRGPKGNYLRLDTRKYQAMGGTVPEDVTNLLNIGPANIQSQHDPSWWFSKTPGEVGKELNAIVNLGLIDQTLANIGSQVRKNRTIVQVSKERLLDARERKRSLCWILEADANLTILERLEGDLIDLNDRQNRLQSLLTQIDSLEQNITTIQETLPPLEKLIKMMEGIESHQHLCDRLQGKIAEVEKWLQAVQLEEKQIEVIQQTIQKKYKHQCPLCGNRLSSPLS